MKLLSASTATLFSLLASSTLAAETSANLRSGSVSSDRELAGGGNNNPVRRGPPSYLEFYNGKCVGFNQEKEGQEAKFVSCGDADASYVSYRDDGLLEIYRNNNYQNLCLEEQGSKLTLYRCDNKEDAQKWFFTQQSVKGTRLYRICSEGNGYCLERWTGNALILDRFDRNDKDQLIILDTNFFNTK